MGKADSYHADLPPGTLIGMAPSLIRGSSVDIVSRFLENDSAALLIMEVRLTHHG